VVISSLLPSVHGINDLKASLISWFLVLEIRVFPAGGTTKYSTAIPRSRHKEEMEEGFS